MSGHSKWSTIKRKKEINDLKRGKLFTKYLNQIVQLSKEGGGDPKSNFLLKNAIDRARAVNVSMDSINKAISKGITFKSSSDFSEYLYEAYGPFGIAIIVKCITDNKNRAISNLRSVVEKNGGKIVDNGTLSWQFDKRGVITIKMEDINNIESIENILINTDGVLDYEYNDDIFSIYTDPKDLKLVKDIIDNNFSINDIEISLIPKIRVKIEGKDREDKVFKFISAIESLDDVDSVYLNV